MWRNLFVIGWEHELDEDNHSDYKDGQYILIISETSSPYTQTTLPKKKNNNNKDSERYILTLRNKVDSQSG